MRYSIDVAGAPGPFAIEVQLWYQSIAYRWAENLRVYRAVEPQRFVSYDDLDGTRVGDHARASSKHSAAVTRRPRLTGVHTRSSHPFMIAGKLKKCTGATKANASACATFCCCTRTSLG